MQSIPPVDPENEEFVIFIRATSGVRPARSEALGSGSRAPQERGGHVAQQQLQTPAQGMVLVQSALSYSAVGYH